MKDISIEKEIKLVISNIQRIVNEAPSIEDKALQNAYMEMAYVEYEYLGKLLEEI